MSKCEAPPLDVPLKPSCQFCPAAPTSQRHPKSSTSAPPPTTPTNAADFLAHARHQFHTENPEYTTTQQQRQQLVLSDQLIANMSARLRSTVLDIFKNHTHHLKISQFALDSAPAFLTQSLWPPVGREGQQETVGKDGGVLNPFWTEFYRTLWKLYDDGFSTAEEDKDKYKDKEDFYTQWIVENVWLKWDINVEFKLPTGVADMLKTLPEREHAVDGDGRWKEIDLFLDMVYELANVVFKYLSGPSVEQETEQVSTGKVEDDKDSVYDLKLNEGNDINFVDDGTEGVNPVDLVSTFLFATLLHAVPFLLDPARHRRDKSVFEKDLHILETISSCLNLVNPGPRRTSHLMVAFMAAFIIEPGALPALFEMAVGNSADAGGNRDSGAVSLRAELASVATDILQSFINKVLVHRLGISMDPSMMAVVLANPQQQQQEQLYNDAYRRFQGSLFEGAYKLLFNINIPCKPSSSRSVFVSFAIPRTRMTIAAFRYLHDTQFFPQSSDAYRRTPLLTTPQQQMMYEQRQMSLVQGLPARFVELLNDLVSAYRTLFDPASRPIPTEDKEHSPRRRPRKQQGYDVSDGVRLSCVYRLTDIWQEMRQLPPPFMNGECQRRVDHVWHNNDWSAKTNDLFWMKLRSGWELGVRGVVNSTAPPSWSGGFVDEVDPYAQRLQQHQCGHHGGSRARVCHQCRSLPQGELIPKRVLMQRVTVPSTHSSSTQPWPAHISPAAGSSTIPHPDQKYLSKVKVDIQNVDLCCQNLQHSLERTNSSTITPAMAELSASDKLAVDRKFSILKEDFQRDNKLPNIDELLMKTMGLVARVGHNISYGV
ncbi:hypothetical protein HK102_013199 [Quaeritorhiza haematococci]|nr:hypothetical protein HK102_013199 [Quaeritorhiza haematococci]